jgi:hypothetical protein
VRSFASRFAGLFARRSHGVRYEKHPPFALCSQSFANTPEKQGVRTSVRTCKADLTIAADALPRACARQRGRRSRERRAEGNVRALIAKSTTSPRELLANQSLTDAAKNPAPDLIGAGE